MHWVARYTDGWELDGRGPDGKGLSSESIDRAKLYEFAIYDGERQVVTLHFEPGSVLLYRRRTKVNADGKYVVHLAAIQREHSQLVVCVDEQTGVVHLTDVWRPDHPWFYEVQRVPCEAI